MSEDTTNIQRQILITVNCRFVCFSCGSDHKCICWHVFEGISDRSHINHAGHVRVSNHALRIVQRVSHLSHIAIDALVFPGLLEWVIWVKRWRGCSLANLLFGLLWSDFLGTAFLWCWSGCRFLYLSFCISCLLWYGSTFTSSHGQIVFLDVLEDIPFLDVVLGPWCRHHRRQDSVRAQPPTSCYRNLKLCHLSGHLCIETTSSCWESSRSASTHHVSSRIATREKKVIKSSLGCSFLAMIDAIFKHHFQACLI